MQEIEILIKDLSASKAQIELERGKKQTKEKIIDFIAEMLKGNPADKAYQKLLSDNLVYKVFVYDKEIVTYLIFGNDKEIKEISPADNDKAITDKGVQPLSPLVRLHRGLAPVGQSAARRTVRAVRGLFDSAATSKKAGRQKSSCFFGAPSGTRTRDPLIKSQLLYQLS